MSVDVIFQRSSIVADEFCMSFPVVVLKRTIALSVAEAGQITSQVHPHHHHQTETNGSAKVQAQIIVTQSHTWSQVLVQDIQASFVFSV
jgi:hypothetical protein